jgi:hemoglobin-like flavoprotein
MGGIVTKREGPKSEPIEPVSVEQLKESWQAVKAYGVDKMGVLLFIKLFDSDPDTFSMFKTFRDEKDWKESKAFHFHSKAFLNVVGGALVNVQTEDALGKTMHTLGSAHSLFDIRKEHFEILKKELMIQLELLLKDKFTPGVRKEWTTAYENVMRAMMFSMSHASGKV